MVLLIKNINKFLFNALCLPLFLLYVIIYHFLNFDRFILIQNFIYVEKNRYPVTELVTWPAWPMFLRNPRFFQTSNWRTRKKSVSASIRTGVRTFDEWYSNRLRHRGLGRFFPILCSFATFFLLKNAKNCPLLAL